MRLLAIAATLRGLTFGICSHVPFKTTSQDLQIRAFDVLLFHLPHLSSDPQKWYFSWHSSYQSRGIIKNQISSLCFARQSCLASGLLVNKHNQIFFQCCIPMCVCGSCSWNEVGCSSSAWLQTLTAAFASALGLKATQVNLLFALTGKFIQVLPMIFSLGLSVL